MRGTPIDADQRVLDAPPNGARGIRAVEAEDRVVALDCAPYIGERDLGGIADEMPAASDSGP